MENNYVFRAMEVTGVNKDEAFNKTPFTAPHDTWINATTAFKKFKEVQTGAISTEVKRQFMNDYLKKKKVAPGVGCYIVIESAVADTRVRPYVKHNVKTDKPKKFKRTFQIYENLGTPENPVNGELLVADAGRTKAEADTVAKALYTEDRLTKNIVVICTMQEKDGNSVAFTMEYAPSKNQKVGVYEVFGLEVL